MAAKYRRIDPRIWTDEGFAELTICEKLITFYTLTAQANRVGLFTFSPGKACEDLKMSRRVFQNAFPKVCQAFGWEWDECSRVLFIPTWWKYNHPENLKHLVGCLKDLADLPQTKLLSIFTTNTQYLESYLHETLRHSSQHSYGIAMGVGQAYQEQEQEQESPLPPKGDSADGVEPLPPEDIRARWNAITEFKICQDLGRTIRARISERLKEYPDRAWWDRLFAQVRNSPFLCGRIEGPKGRFQATLDWTVGPKNLDKILAGNYDDTPAASQKTDSFCVWRVANGRHSKLCGKSVSAPESHCSEHLTLYRAERQHIAKLQEAVQ